MCARVQGYGLTESCGASCVANPNVHSEAGTVGAPVAGLEVRLEAVPDMGYDPLATPPRGELLVRGETMFTAYHKREDLTSEAVGVPLSRVSLCICTRRSRLPFRYMFLASATMSTACRWQCHKREDLIFEAVGAPLLSANSVSALPFLTFHLPSTNMKTSLMRLSLRSFALCLACPGVFRFDS